MPNFCIMRIKKMHSDSNVAGALAHHLRTRETDNADPEKLRNNWYSGNEYTKDANGRLDKSTNEDIEARRKMKAVALAKYRRNLPDKIRKNAVRSVEFMMTVSPEVMSRKDFNSVKYLNDCAEWVRQKFGKDNVFFVAHHRDETTPHISILITPKDENGKLNARKFFGGREKLSELQTSFYEEVGKAHGLERGIRGSKAKHKTIKTWYAEQNQEAKKLEEVAQDIAGRIPEKRFLQSEEEHQADILQAVQNGLVQLRPDFKKAVSARQTEERLQGLQRNFEGQVKAGIEVGKNELKKGYEKQIETLNAKLQSETTTVTYKDGVTIKCEGGILAGLRERADIAYQFKTLTPYGLRNLADRMEKLDIDGEQAYKQAHAKGLEIGDWLDTPIKTKSRGYGGFSMSD